MKRDMIFFSQDGQGLTSTSANHLANLAKEMIRGLETSLNAMVFYSTDVALIGTDTADQVSIGATESELDEVVGKLHSIAKAKSLIAWLREAIKAKERLQDEVSDLTLSDYAKTVGIELPKKPEPVDSIDDDEYYASLSIGERNRYYEAETLASVLGKAIHPDGSFANAREDLDRHIRKPRNVKGDGRDTLIYSHRPTVNPQKVDEIYFKLQKQYREAQATVNAFKHDCQKAVTVSEIASNTQDAENTAAYNHQIEQLNADMSKYKKQRMAEIGDYRIVIPQSLQEIYATVSQLGKH